MNYRPNSLAKSFASKRSGYIGLAVPFEGLLGSTYFSRLVSGIQLGLEDSDWQLALFDTLSESFNKGDKLASLYHEKRVDGLIAIAPHSNESFIDKLSEEDIPVIIAGEPTLNGTVLSVNTDDELCVSRVVRYLKDLGHREIGFIEGPKDLLSARMRATSFRRAMAACGLTVSEDSIFCGNYSRSCARDRSLHFFDKGAVPTAMIASNDLMALGFLDAATIRGINVPSEVSVVGIDDLFEAKSSYPPLTTMHQPVQRMGEVAVECLLSWIQTGKKPPTIKPLGPEIVERASVQDLSINA
jgi:LacI family transcriptional regulator